MFHNFERVIESYGEEKANKLAALINSACETLKVSAPEIQFHDHVCCTPSNEIMVLDDYHGKDFKGDAYKARFDSSCYGLHIYVPEYDGCLILVSLRDEDNKLRPLSHVMHTTVHELRHTWQYRIGLDKKYRKYTRPHDSLHGYLNDPSEIDADAFSAMIMEQRTEYRPHLTSRKICFDKKRNKRMKELKKEYFPCEPNNQRTA